MIDWLNQVIEIGTALSVSDMRRVIDSMTITIEPEFGFVKVEAVKNGMLYTADRCDQFPEVTIKIAPQDAATSTGAEA